MKALYKPVNGAWEMREIPNTLKALQETVGGYIETVTLRDGSVVICDEEGKLKGKKINAIINGIPFVGDLIVCGTKGAEFCGLQIESPEEWLTGNEVVWREGAKLKCSP